MMGRFALFPPTLKPQQIITQDEIIMHRSLLFRARVVIGFQSRFGYCDEGFSGNLPEGDQERETARGKPFMIMAVFSIFRKFMLYGMPLMIESVLICTTYV
jgi:hypothetical protein